MEVLIECGPVLQVKQQVKHLSWGASAPVMGGQGVCGRPLSRSLSVTLLGRPRGPCMGGLVAATTSSQRSAT